MTGTILAQGNDLARNIVAVVVVMVIDGKISRRAIAKEGHVIGVPAHRLGMPDAAYVVVETHHPVGGRHDQMKIVGHHEDTATMAVPDAPDNPVELCLPAHIDALCRFVEDKELGIADQGTGQQDAPCLATRKFLDRALQNLRRADLR
jgi:hypothetical protein